jgi:hypothetical protein
MIWSNERPPRYRLHCEDAGGRRLEPAHTLIADSLDDAKLEAAIVYACADFAVVPQSYRIVRGAKRVVYRYPEPLA